MRQVLAAPLLSTAPHTAAERTRTVTSTCTQPSALQLSVRAVASACMQDEAEPSARQWGTPQSAALAKLLPHCYRLRALSLRGQWTLTELPAQLGDLPPPPPRPFVRGVPMGMQAAQSVALLEALDISGCGLRTLPDNLARLGHLKRLRLEWCVALLKLPETLGELRSLRDLRLTGCELLMHLPQSVASLPHLEGLRVDFCASLLSLPARLAKCRTLHHLSATGCRQLPHLPPGLRRLPSLHYLGLGGCFLLGHDQVRASDCF